jgi:hypothetical protein
MIIMQVRNPIARVVLFALPLLIFAILYFTVIKPSSDTANDAVRSATQTATEQLKQARKDAPPQAQKALSDAQKLTACVSAAGTDAGKLQACQVKFGG